MFLSFPPRLYREKLYLFNWSRIQLLFPIENMFTWLQSFLLTEMILVEVFFLSRLQALPVSGILLRVVVSSIYKEVSGFIFIVGCRVPISLVCTNGVSMRAFAWESRFLLSQRCFQFHNFFDHQKQKLCDHESLIVLYKVSAPVLYLWW